MIHRRPVLPSEIVHAIVSRIVVHHIDDVLVGSMSALNAPHIDEFDIETGGPVTTLLVASCQLRQTTLMILANTLNIAMSRDGVWRLLEKPWAKIEPVRDFLIARVGDDREPESILGFVCAPETEWSPALSIYAYLHIFEETIANPFQPISVPSTESEEQLTLTLEAVHRFCEDKLRAKYDECISAFQDIFYARVESAFARCTATLVYDNLIKLIEETWDEIFELSEQLYGNPPMISVDTFEINIKSITSMIRNLPKHEQQFHSAWTFSMPVDTAIVESRFEDWILLFSIIAGWDSPCKSTPDLRKAAQDTEDMFRARLARLHGEDVPGNSNHHSTLSQEGVGGSSEGTDMLLLT